MDPPSRSGKYDKNNEEYIQTLNERNHIKKIMNAKSEQEKILEEREKGFTTHFAGANNTQTKPTTIKPTIRGSSFKNLKPKSEGVRRGWGTDAPKFILGQKGPVPIRADKDVVVSNHPSEWSQPLSTDIDDDEEVAESSSLKRISRQEKYDDDEDYNDKDDHSIVMEDSLNEAPGEDDEERYEYEEDFEADEFEEERDGSEEEVEYRDRNASSWKGNVNSPKSVPWKSVVSSRDQAEQQAMPKNTNSPSIETSKKNVAPESNLSLSSNSRGSKIEATRSQDHTEPRSAKPDSSEIKSVSPKGDLAEAIALRLASMSEDQQRQLLQMLNLSDHPPSSKVEAQKPLRAGENSSPKLERKLPDQTKSELNQNTPLSCDPIDPQPRVSMEPILCTSEVESEDKSGFESSLEELTTFKIKLHNSWQKTKYSSLASIRLLKYGSNKDIDLSNFSSQVWVGSTMLPKSSEVAHSVSHLFAKSRVRQHKDWKFPIDTGAQLILTGKLNVPLHELELLIWNGINDAIATSPVRDADIYVNNSLLWSGVLNQLTTDNLISLRGLDHSPRILCVTPNEGRSPSNVIPLSSNFNDSKKSTIVTTIPLNPTQKNSGETERVPLSDESLTFSGLASSNFSGETGKSDVPNEESSVPTWLSDLKTPRPGHGSQNAIEFESSEENALVDYPIITKSSRPGSRRARTEAESKADPLPPKQPSSRGSRRHPKVQETQLDLSAAIHKPQLQSNKKKSRREMQEDDMSLRQSLDALNDSDRKNRGRLQQELTTAVISGSVEYPSPIFETCDDNQQGIPLEATVAVNLQMKALENLSGGVLDQELQSNGQKAVLRQRSERIDRVQEKVSSALASLAGVISTLPGGTKSNRNQFRMDSEPIRRVYSPSSNVQESSLPISIAETNRTVDQAPNVDVDDDISKILEMVNGLDMEMSQSVFVQDDKKTVPQVADENFFESSIRETPIFPKGRVLEIVILSTWGDPYYIGLNGIDIFDSEGQVLVLQHGIKSITSNPSDINILPEYHDDPRVVQNLLDQVNFTRDDLHVWLAPHGSTLSPKLPYVATICIELERLTTLSMIRIWNYNKSRTHCYRGAKHCQIKFDSKLLYEGSIRMAPGLISCSDDCNDMIVFCNDRKIFRKILEYDISIGYQSQGKELEPSLQFINGKKIDERPTTADNNIQQELSTSDKIVYRKKPLSESPLPYEKVVPMDGHRPTTAAIRQDEVQTKSNHRSILKAIPQETNESEYLECQSITISIDRTWGDNCYVGLAGLEILDESRSHIELDPRMIDASPKDLSAIGFFGDPRTPDKLIDGFNDTTDDTHMWLIPFTKGSTHILKFTLERKSKISGFHIWNYNKSPVDSLRGARIITIYADSILLGSVELRIAPGCDGVEFKQTILVNQLQASGLSRLRPDVVRYITPSLKQDYEVPLLPSGMCWKITLHSNWGDGYYIGLDGLEFLDDKGEVIPLNSTGRITASPYSLRDIGVQDSRIPSNLSCQPYSDPSGCTSWLAPLAQCMTENEKLTSLKYLNQQRGYNLLKKTNSTESYEPLFYDENMLFILFDQPVVVSVIRFYNYTKTPKRGVKEFSIEIDGNIVSMGTLRSAENSDFVATGQSIVFSNDPKITRMEKNKIHYCGSTEQDVLCINERQVIIRSKFMYDPPSVASEGIYSDLSNRPTTALVT